MQAYVLANKYEVFVLNQVLPGNESVECAISHRSLL